MKVILAAAISGELAHPEVFLDFDIERKSDAENYRKSNAYASRHDYHEHELNQSWEELRDPQLGEGDAIVISVSNFSRVSCRGEAFYIAIADCGEYFETGGSVVAAESSLTETMREIIQHHNPTDAIDMAWVERCALVQKSTQVPKTWFESDPLMWKARTSDESFEDSEISFAWGNSAIVGNPSDEDLKSIFYAYIDSLAIWTDMEKISQHAAKIIHDIAREDIVISERKRLKESLNGLERLSTDVVYHHLLLNDVYLRIPGLRRVATLKLLESWSYQISADRLTQLVEKAETLTNQRKANIERKSRNYVEWVAFSLAVVGLMQITLGIYGAAFTGYDEETPVETTGLQLLAFLREFDFELVIGLTLLIVGGTIGSALFISRMAGRKHRRRYIR